MELEIYRQTIFLNFYAITMQMIAVEMQLKMENLFLIPVNQDI